MSRYIDADKARDNSTDPYVRIYLDSQPTADVAPVVHAHWIRRTRDHRNDYYDVMEHPYRCSACREKSKELTKRCPECGARMDKEVKHNEQ